MRELTRKPIEEMDIDQVKLELHSRDDIPQILKGLQYIFLTPALRQEVFILLNGVLPPELDLNNEQPGMDMWSIFVMGVIRLSLNCDYDCLHDLINNHKTIRQILDVEYPTDTRLLFNAVRKIIELLMSLLTFRSFLLSTLEFFRC